MKKLIFIFLSFIFIFSVGMNAQKGRLIKAHVLHKVRAKKIIRRTAIVLIAARKQVIQNKNFTGDLARAVRHQHYARLLYMSGKYARAIHQSRRARQLAFITITSNKGTINKEWELGPDENADDGSKTADAELDKELPDDKVTDQDLINSELTDIDLSDND